MEATREDPAWAAGFVDGDGSISDNGGRYLALRAGNTDRSLLLRLQRTVGCGNVTGPYDHAGRVGAWSLKPRYFFQAYAGGERAIADLWFALSDARRSQAIEAARRFGRDGDGSS